MTRAKRWTGWRLAAAILGLIAATATAQQPGGLGGFFAASWGRGVEAGPTGPTDYLHFWDPAGTLSSDDQADGLDATLYGGLTETSADGWNMGTDNAKYAATSGPWTNGLNYTITAWVKPDLTAIAAQLYGAIISERPSVGVANMDFQILCYTNRFSIFAISTGNSVLNVDNYTVYDDVWTHVAGIVDADNDILSLIVNGTNSVSTAMTFTPSDRNADGVYFGVLGPFYLGDAKYKYHGSIGKVRLYNRALSQSEIQSEIDADGGTGP